MRANHLSRREPESGRRPLAAAGPPDGASRARTGDLLLAKDRRRVAGRGGLRPSADLKRRQARWRPSLAVAGRELALPNCFQAGSPTRLDPSLGFSLASAPFGWT